MDVGNCTVESRSGWDILQYATELRGILSFEYQGCHIRMTPLPLYK